MDGTQILTWASHKNFKRKDGGDDSIPSGPARIAQTNWKGKARSNDTHDSTGLPAVPPEPQHGSAVVLPGPRADGEPIGLGEAIVTHADGFGERAAALSMLDTVPGRAPKTVGGDKAYNTADFVRGCRERGVTPHVAANETTQRLSAINGRTTLHASYDACQVVRKRTEEHFGWGKTDWAHPADGLPRVHAGRSALQAEEGRLEFCPNGSNARRGTATSCTMSSPSCTKGRWRTEIDQRERARPAQNSSRTPEGSVMTIMSWRNATAC